ncbi:MAG: divalent-cation tolerance protein CutA [Bacillota bacterium]|nr:cation tolerance protein CutA [Bacillota bacterium]REJ37246.1 MAG: cation tolerance protein CutA [Bacillota bacterium]
MADHLLVYITTPNEEEALRIGRAVVERRLAACANVVPAIRSLYWWEGRLVEDGEALLFLKTRAAVLQELIQAVRELHSYSVPCITAFPIVGGNPDYLKWVTEETAGGLNQEPGAEAPGLSGN